MPRSSKLLCQDCLKKIYRRLSDGPFQWDDRPKRNCFMHVLAEVSTCHARVPEVNRLLALKGNLKLENLTLTLGSHSLLGDLGPVFQ